MAISFSKIQLRITALWAFSEALLGGMLHGFHVPFAGLVLSAFASICMAALTLHDPAKGKILKATILVIIIKAILSPHTPPTAYFAVFLQGFFGEMIFSSGLPYFFACVTNSVFALMQTAFQKLIVLTILFGTGIWKAMDEFLNSISAEFGVANTSYSYYFIVIFLVLHLITGIAAGIFAGRLPKLMQSKQNIISINYVDRPINNDAAAPKRNRLFKNLVIWIMFILLAAVLYNLYTDSSFVSIISSKPLRLLIRSFIILLLWYFFIAPVLLKLFHKWLAKQQNKFSVEVENILHLIPEMKYITELCWLSAAGVNVFSRIFKFIRVTFFTLLSFEK